MGGKFGKISGISLTTLSLLLLARFSMVNAILVGFLFSINIIRLCLIPMYVNFSTKNFVVSDICLNRGIYIPPVINLITFVNTV